ncbi:uncharacterized protein DUF481 [Maribacter vaceletii]|uniref:Uncharacterized protein DUF481 n=1 Tax=Maribacter vaceletii TaxID=1206816 RepID=A0A495DV07_9FLAO|nr:DUF481 domain-containing protein [Maribacter vaceletii]RKR06516.1 uncharacterized protein DUF481 [Maribacter vaceletii]
MLFLRAVKWFSILLLLFPLICFSQTNEKESIKLFIDCNCEKNYIRQEIKFINHVRDQGLANVRLFIYDIANGSGGRTYKLEFAGSDSFLDITNFLSFDTNANMTSDEVRRGLVWRIKKGLLKFVVESDIAHRVSYRVKGKNEKSELEFEDPWRNWIFEIYGQAKLDKESSRKKFEYKLGLESDRVTEKWRIRADLQMSQTNSEFIRNDEKFTSERERYWGAASIVRSLSDHWSAGVFVNGRHDTYTNLDLSAGFFPAVEYNIFPYSEVLKREIVFAYKIGYKYNDYIETTIFAENQEGIFNHSFDMQLRYRQQWGNVYYRVKASSFLEDFSKNRFEMNGSFSVRVFKGLGVKFSGNYQVIRDQINLPAGDASLEDVLLQQKQIATDFDLGFSVGLTYTFGSAFNNIINTRL